MELHFCSQCGISIPLAEVQSGAANAGENRFVCSEHRAGAKPAPEAPKEEVQLLFCANCQVSVPASDMESGRAKKEFGSLLCAPCSAGDQAERDRRRKAVEAEMAADAVPPAKTEDTAETRRCGVCSAPVPQAQIAAGRAVIDGTRVICPNCRAAGARAPAPAAAATGGGGGTWVLVGLLAVAVFAAGFFGVEYLKARKGPATAAAPAAGARDVADLRMEMDRRIAALESATTQRMDEAKAAERDAVELVQSRVSEDLLALREDLADVRSRLTSTDNEVLQRLAKLEGQVGGLQEMVKGLASRPSEVVTRGPSQSPPDVKPPEGPVPEGPKAPAPVPAGPGPEVARLIKDLLEGKDEGTRFAAAVELIRRKERAAIPAFAQALVQDTNVMVRRSAASGLGEMKAWYGVPVLIQAIEDKEAYVAARANFALQNITGQDFGVTIEHSSRDRKLRAMSAAKWWEKNKDSPPDGVCLEPVNLPPAK